MRLDTPFTPNEVNYDSQRIDVLENHFQNLYDKGILQGVNYCLSREGKVFAEGTMGELEQGNSTPMPRNAVFKVASITKLFTAVAVMKLVEDGVFRLEEPVSIFLDEFKEEPFDKITFAHLLTHTSGLQADQNCFPNKYFLSPWECIERGFKVENTDWLRNALRSGLRRETGTEWAYSTFGFVVLGEALSRALGYPVGDYIKKEILEPCEMMDSGFQKHFRAELLPRLSYGNSEHKELKQMLSGEIPIPEIEKMWMELPDTGGGLISTVEDLNNFGVMMISDGYFKGKRVIGRKAIEKMTARHTDSSIKEYCWGNNGVERAYGLGPDLRNNLATVYSKETFFHEGWGSSCLMMDPKEKLVAAWYVPYPNGEWHAEGLYNAASIMWSGLR